MPDNIFKIQFANGETKRVEPVALNPDKTKEFLSSHTGLIFDEGDLYAQTVGVLNAWMCGHSPSDEEWPDISAAAIFTIAHALAEKTGGYIIVTQDEARDIYVFVPSKEGVIPMQEMFSKVLDGDYDYNSSITKVTLPKGKVKVTTDELREQLKEAISNEDYEQCAKLRDKIDKREKKNKTTRLPFGTRTSKK